MLRIVVPFYLICLALYIFFTRQPDYQDGEFLTATIHYINNKAQAIYTIDEKTYTIPASYPLRKLSENDKVKIIYDTSNPVKATVFKWWGYWLRWDELLASIIIPVILLYAAKTITGNPTPEALIEELEMDNNTKRTKYD